MINKVEEAAKDCDSYKCVAAKLNAKESTVRTYLSKLKIVLQGSGSNTEKAVKNNPFSNNFTSNYWKGYIAADGNLSKINYTISIVSKDIDHLVKIKEFIPSIHLYYRKNGMLTAYFGSKETWKYLVEIGITPKKSRNLVLKEPITWDFLRGLFDGDGHFRFVKSGVEWNIVTASPCFANQVSSFLTNQDIKNSVLIKDKRTPTYAVSVRNRKGVGIIYYNMYKNDSVSLNRKKETMRRYIEIYNVNPVNSEKVREDNTEPSQT